MVFCSLIDLTVNVNVVLNHLIYATELYITCLKVIQITFIN